MRRTLVTIALVGAIHDGQEGFGVLVGGGLSSVPRIARPMNVFVPKEESIEVLWNSGSLTSDGERFVKGMRAAVDAWADDG